MRMLPEIRKLTSEQVKLDAHLVGYCIFLSAFERAGMILTGTNSSHAPSSSHLAKVYPTSTSMHLAWVADPFFSDFQKRSPLSFALSSKHKSYAKLF